MLVSPNFTDPLKWLQHRVDGSHGSVSSMTLCLRHLCAAFGIDFFSTFMSTTYVADLCHLQQRIFRACGRLLLASHTTAVITLITARSLNQYATGVDRTPCLLTREGHSTLDVHPGWRCSRERGTLRECDTQDVLRAGHSGRGATPNSAPLRKADGDQTPQRPAAPPRPPFDRDYASMQRRPEDPKGMYTTAGIQGIRTSASRRRKRIPSISS